MILSHHGHFCVLITIGLLLTSCGAKAVTNETWALVELMTKGERVDTVTEVIEVRNCGVAERKTVTCSAGTTNELNVSLGGGISLGEGFSGQIDGNIITGLGLGRDSGEGLDLDIPAEGSIYRYTLNKEFRIVSGEVLARSSNGDERKAGYTFQANCSLRIVKRETSACPGIETPQATNAAVPTTATLPTSQTPPQPQPTVPSAVVSKPPTAYHEQGATYQQNGDYGSAISIFLTCIQLYPSYGDCYNGLGMAYREIGDFSLALSNHNKAIELNHVRFDYYFERGVTYQRMADYERSIADFEGCIERNPNFAHCYNGLGMSYRDKNKFELALTYHNKAIELTPGEASFYWERGVTYQRMGDQTHAADDFAKARQLGYGK